MAKGKRAYDSVDEFFRSNIPTFRPDSHSGSVNNPVPQEIDRTTPAMVAGKILEPLRSRLDELIGKKA